MCCTRTYVGQDTYLFPLSVRDNLLFGLKFRPVAPASYDDATRAVREAFWKESERAGNPPFDPTADWIDYELAGATGPADLLPHGRGAEQVELDEISTRRPARYGRCPCAPIRREDPGTQCCTAGCRTELCRAGRDVQRHRYNRNLSVAENLLFGTPLGKTSTATASRCPHAIDPAGDWPGTRPRAWVAIAETMVELFSTCRPTTPVRAIQFHLGR
jgi:putative ABC transport system ATP-binding protein